MNMFPYSRKSFLKHAASVALLATAALQLHAQTVSTPPEGYFTITISAGTGTSSALTVLSLPLEETASISGQAAGRLTGVGVSTLTNSSGGWTTGSLSQAATPYFIRITSGAAAGRTFLISTSTANTGNALTLDLSDAPGLDLTTLGIQTGANGDTYEIKPADTIASVFGTGTTSGTLGVLSGSSANVADKIQLLVGGIWTSYYYNTTSGWISVGPPIPSGNVPIRPDTAVIYSRLAATSFPLTVMGRVPSIARKASVPNSGTTLLSTFWPVDVTLTNSNIHNLPGWVTSSSYTSADLLQVYTPSHIWQQYYNNGTHWLQVGPPINSDTDIIPAGSAVIIFKRGNASGQAVLSQSVPYSL